MEIPEYHMFGSTVNSPTVVNWNDGKRVMQIYLSHLKTWVVHPFAKEDTNKDGTFDK